MSSNHARSARGRLSPKFKRALIVSALLSASSLTGCVSTIVETYYEYRLAGGGPFSQPGQYVCDFGAKSLELHDSGQKIRLKLRTDRVSMEGGVLEFVYSDYLHDRVDAEFVSREFTVITADETFHPTYTYRESGRVAAFLVRIPSRLETFTMDVPDVVIDGVEHSIPLIDFRKVTGQRTINGFLCAP